MQINRSIRHRPTSCYWSLFLDLVFVASCEKGVSETRDAAGAHPRRGHVDWRIVMQKVVLERTMFKIVKRRYFMLGQDVLTRREAEKAIGDYGKEYVVVETVAEPSSPRTVNPSAPQL